MAVEETATTPLFLIPLYCVTLGWFVSTLIRGWRRFQQRPPLPPGPPGWPLIGNTLEWPDIRDQTKVFNDWARTYGPVVHARVMGQHFVILNTTTAADDLLTKRSGNYSDRHHTTINDIAGISEWSIPFMPYSNRWREFRKQFHSTFRVQDVEALHPIIFDASTEFLQQLSNSPEDFRLHIRSYTSKIIARFVYGHDQPMATKDPLVTVLDEFMDTFNEKIFNRLFLVDLLPFLRHIPVNWPCAGFKRTMISLKNQADSIKDGLFNRFQNAATNGTAASCVIAHSLENIQPDSFNELVIKGNAATSFGAGTDTSASVLANFFLAMTLHPAIQKLAQQEIDHVTEGTRLPGLEDKNQLHCITAIFLESLRWNAPLPVGVPHKAVNDDLYMGMRIPAGSVVIGNIAAMLHNEEHFETPESFNPSRFIDAEGAIRTDLEKLVMDVFGFGRRICPGRHLAMDSNWTTIARVLATFDIKKPLDENGKEVEPEARFTAGFTSHPVPFGCRIVARSDRADLIQA